MSNSLSVACFRIRLHKSIVNRVLELLNIDVRELMIADNITAIIKPRRPIIKIGFYMSAHVFFNLLNELRKSNKM